MQYACLGLWSTPADGQARTLKIAAEYRVDETESRLTGNSYAPSSFPPEQISNLTRALGEGNVLTIVPLVSSRHNRGLLAVAAPIEVELLDHVGNAGDWAAQVGAALERAEVDQQLRKNAFHDALTGLPNRAYLMERLEQRRRQPGAGSAFVLISRVKNITTASHEAGANPDRPRARLDARSRIGLVARSAATSSRSWWPTSSTSGTCCSR